VSTSPSASSWRKASIVLGCSLVLLLAIYWATAASAIALWSQDPLSHGYLVIPAAAYLVWGRRRILESLSPTPAFRALLLLGPLAFLWLLGNLTGTSIAQQFCLVAMLIGFVWGVLGTSAARALLFPAGLLLFALPIGDRFIPMLQDFTAAIVVKMFELSRVPVLLEGHVISIQGRSWQVAEACSGINYLTASLAVGYLYAGTAYRYWVHRGGFILASAVVPLAGNLLRVYTTILIDSLGGTRIATGMEHYLYGFVVFAMITGLLFRSCGHWREEPLDEHVVPSGPQRAEPHMPVTSVWGSVVFAILGILVVGIAPLSAKSFELRVGTEEPGRPKPLEVSQPWGVADRDPYTWAPRLATPGAEFLQAYDSENRPVKLYVARYGANQPGIVLFDEPWWSIAEGHPMVTVQGQSFQVRQTTLRSQESSLVVWNWYRVDGRFTGNGYVAKLLLAKSRLFRRRQDSAAIVVATENRPGVDAATILQDFLRHVSL
jgi:exosortase A